MLSYYFDTSTNFLYLLCYLFSCLVYFITQPALSIYFFLFMLFFWLLSMHYHTISILLSSGMMIPLSQQLQLSGKMWNWCSARGRLDIQQFISITNNMFTFIICNHDFWFSFSTCVLLYTFIALYWLYLCTTSDSKYLPQGMMGEQVNNLIGSFRLTVGAYTIKEDPTT